MVFLCFSGRCHGNMCNWNVIVVLEFISGGLYLLFAILLSSKFQNSIFYQHMRPKSGLKFPRPLARPRRLIVSIDLLWEKNSKIFFSETTGHTALIFCMWQWLMVLYINCASHAPGVKFGHALGVDSLHRPTMGKTNKNLLL